MTRPLLADSVLTSTIAMPAGASAVVTNGIDLVNTVNGDFVAPCELLVKAPAVTTGMLGDAATVKYDIVTGDTVNGSGVIQSPVTVAATVLTQTGAGGVGAAAATVRYALPSDVKRYVGVRATKSAAGDASSVSVTVQVVM